MDECWEVLRDSMVDIAKDVCGIIKMYKSKDAWWDDEVKFATKRKKKTAPLCVMFAKECFEFIPIF